METLSDRLEAALRAAGKDQNDLAAALGVARQTVSAMKRGVMPGRSHWPRIAELLHVDCVWLTEGGGVAPDWLPSSPPAPVISAPSEIPMVGVVTAGDGWATCADDGSMIRLRGGLVAVRVQGCSAEPMVRDGQYVIADPHRNGQGIAHDAVVVVRDTEGGAWCKRWSGIHDGKMFLSSIHEGRGSVVIDADGVIAWQVVGILFNEAVR
jgi:DNA-binding XRE family transcriptional regulator